MVTQLKRCNKFYMVLNKRKSVWWRR